MNQTFKVVGTQVVPVEPENGYPFYSAQYRNPRSLAHLYDDELLFNIKIKGIRATALDVIKKYQTKLKKALKGEKIPAL